MNLSTGIIGLPNVGKSTLFNAITNSQVEAANYPFATIEPNVGIVNLKDERLDNLAKLINPDRVVYSTVKFVDIAGLVKGASKGEGLGNKFLQNIRDVNAICHVVRCFENNDITHVNNVVDPITDVEIINLELIYSDLEIVENRLKRIEKLAKSGDKNAQEEYELMNKLHKTLLENKKISTLTLNEKEQKMISSFNLITNKPTFYVANIGENEIDNPMSNKHFVALSNYVKQNNEPLIAISAKIESELSQLDESSKKEFMKELGLKETGLNQIVRQAFNILELCTFFTFGKIEVRSWVFKKGWTAPQCAGVIHSDFERGFIKAEVIKYDDMIKYQSENAIKENGKLNIEGKNYIMQDGDICNFKFNV